MATLNKHNPIHFWCLKNHLEYYQAEFKGYAVKVQAIEDCLESGITKKQFVNPEGEVIAKRILDQMKILLAKSQGRYRIRDFVTIKEMIAFYLLATQGGFFMDTNVGPIGDKDIEAMPGYSTFCVPFMKNIEEREEQHECWMMYSPPNNKIAEKILQDYFASYAETEKIFAEYGYSKEYNKVLGIVIGVLRDNVPGISDDWIVYYDNRSRVVELENLNVRKTYYNTHKLESAETGKIVEHLMLLDKHEALHDMLKADAKLAQQSIHGLPLIAQAIAHNAVKCMTLLETEYSMKVTPQIIDALMLDIIHNNQLTKFKNIIEGQYIDINKFALGDKKLIQLLLESDFTAGLYFVVSKNIVMDEKLKLVISCLRHNDRDMLKKLLDSKTIDYNAIYEGKPLLYWAIRLDGLGKNATMLARNGAVITDEIKSILGTRYKIKGNPPRLINTIFLTPSESDEESFSEPLQPADNIKKLAPLKDCVLSAPISAHESAAAVVSKSLFSFFERDQSDKTPEKDPPTPFVKMK